MSANSKIEWTGDTWPTLAGCSDASPGCARCYAKGQAHRMGFNPNAKISGRYGGLTVLRDNGPQWIGEVRTLPEQLAVPIRRKSPRTMFVNSLSDTFHADVPDEFIAAMFGVMAACPQHTFQVLTKRAERMEEWFTRIATHPTLRSPCAMADHAAYLGGIRGKDADAINALYRRPPAWPLPNVHVGVSVENRKHGVPRIDHLRRVPAAVRFLSVEPLLEDIGTIDLTGISWCIAGSESGHRARPMNEDWVRSIRDQCAPAGVPFFYKQRLDAKGRKISLPMLDGVQHAAFPSGGAE